ncbi:MAG TPA: hypothetical protein VFE58_17185 [Tepidisphaeraceae bacterium]|jgi:hypothetical protein|nr:hypothetical protein [Tepidisphaeraceae bacterium]
MRSDVVIVLKHSSDAMNVIGEICGRDGIVHECDSEHGVIEATLGCEHVGALHKLDGVSYVRPVITYCDAA